MINLPGCRATGRRPTGSGSVRKCPSHGGRLWGGAVGAGVLGLELDTAHAAGAPRAAPMETSLSPCSRGHLCFVFSRVQFVSLDETTLNHQLNDRLVTYSARHRNIPCWISNIKEFHAKSHNQFSSLLLKSSSKSTFHHKILPGTGDDVTSIERLVTYWIAVHPGTGWAYGYIILPMVSIPRWWVATWGLFSK